jgi:hypothetical protein
MYATCCDEKKKELQRWHNFKHSLQLKNEPKHNHKNKSKSSLNLNPTAHPTSHDFSPTPRT